MLLEERPLEEHLAVVCDEEARRRERRGDRTGEFAAGAEMQ